MGCDTMSQKVAALFDMYQARIKSYKTMGYIVFGGFENLVTDKPRRTGNEMGAQACGGAFNCSPYSLAVCSKSSGNTSISDDEAYQNEEEPLLDPITAPLHLRLAGLGTGLRHAAHS